MLTLCPLGLFFLEIFSGVSSIKLFGNVPYLVFPIFPIIKVAIGVNLTILIKMAGNTEEGSLKLIEQWKLGIGTRNTGDSFRKAFARSCQPVNAKLGSFTSLGIHSVAFYSSLMIDQTISALVMMQFD